MRFSLLRCGSVIALMLLAVSAWAQSDSVLVRFSALGGRYSKDIIPTFKDQFGNTIDCPCGRFTAYLGSHCEFLQSGDCIHSFITGNVDTISYVFDTSYYGWSFFAIVDHSKGQFRQVAFSEAINYIHDGYEFSSEFSFDSVPLTQISTILALGRFPAVYHGSAASKCDPGWGGAGCYGSFDTSVQETDSLYIQISPYSATVLNSTPIRDSTLHLVWDAATRSISAHFPNSNSQRVLEICDLLGRIKERIIIPSELESTQLRSTLPPACYFARLGDQVAKFLVTP